MQSNPVLISDATYIVTLVLGFDVLSIFTRGNRFEFSNFIRNVNQV